MSLSHANLELTPKKWPWIQKMAKKNHPQAMYLLGVAYLLGGLVDINPAQAYLWFKRAANKEHADAAFRCGFILIHHSEQIKDEITPEQWFETSANLGSPAGMCAKANLWTTKKLNALKWWNKWLHIEDKSPEATGAYNLYNKAAVTNYTPALYFQGLHLLNGWGVKKDKNKAQQVWLSGSNDKDKDCAYALAQSYTYNSNMYWEYLEKAADLGHAHAQWVLALALQSKKDERAKEQALNWLRRSAMQRHPKSMLLLSQTLFYGRGVPSNPTEAYRWARRCAMMSGCNPSWPNKILNTLEEEQRTYEVQKDSEDEHAFMAITHKLFGAPGTPNS